MLGALVILGSGAAATPNGPSQAPGIASSEDQNASGIYDELESRLERAGAGERFSVIVMLRDSAPADAIDRLADLLEFQTERRFRIIPAFVAELTSTQIHGLAASRLVRHVEPNSRVYPLNDGAQESTGVTQARLDHPELDGDGDGDPDSYSPDDLVAAVIDSGIDADHQDLDGGKVLAFKDIVNGQEEPYDDTGHGTHVASIIAGSGKVDPRYRGVAPAAGLVGVKVLHGTASDVVAGIEWVVENREEYGIDVLNVSIGSINLSCSSGNSSGAAALNAAADEGIVPVVGAGNDGPATCTVSQYAAAAEVLAAGAIRDSSKGGFALARFSSRGPTGDGRVKPDVVAPGVDLMSAAANTGDGYSPMGGTSAASPFVAGVALLMLDANPDLSPEGVKQRIMSTAVDMARGGDNLTAGSSGPDIDFGAGRIDAYAAIAAAGAPLNAPPYVPAHRLLEGELSQSGEVGTHTIEVSSTRFPLALTGIVPDFDPLTRWPVWQWPLEDPIQLSLRGPSGGVVAQGEGQRRQETLLHQPSQTGTYVLEVRSDLESVDYFVDVSYGRLVTEITSHPPELTNSTSAEFSFAADDPEATFECRRDDADFESCVSPISYSDLPEGEREFWVRATDQAGNVEEPALSYAWTVDLTPPVSEITSTPPVVTNQTSAELSFAAGDPEATFECRLDGGEFEPCVSPASYDELDEGEHEFWVRATDQAGNVEEPTLSYAWTVDLTPPVSEIISGPPSLTNDTSAEFSFGAVDDPEASFECRLDGGEFEPCTSPASYEDLGEGEHTFGVRATDQAGNVEESAQSFSWTVDLTPPVTQITSGPSGETSERRPAFEFVADDPDAAFRCRFDGEPAGVCSSPYRPASSLSLGAHVFEVWAIDGAGNVEPEPASRAFTVVGDGEPGSPGDGGSSGSGGVSEPDPAGSGSGPSSPPDPVLGPRPISQLEEGGSPLAAPRPVAVPVGVAVRRSVLAGRRLIVSGVVDRRLAGERVELLVGDGRRLLGRAGLRADGRGRVGVSGVLSRRMVGMGSLMVAIRTPGSGTFLGEKAVARVAGRSPGLRARGGRRTTGHLTVGGPVAAALGGRVVMVVRYVDGEGRPRRARASARRQGDRWQARLVVPSDARAGIVTIMTRGDHRHHGQGLTARLPGS